MPICTEHYCERRLVRARIRSNCQLTVGLTFEQVVVALVTDQATAPVVSSFTSALRLVVAAGFRLLSPAASFVPVMQDSWQPFASPISDGWIDCRWFDHHFAQFVDDWRRSKIAAEGTRPTICS